MKLRLPSQPGVCEHIGPILGHGSLLLVLESYRRPRFVTQLMPDSFRSRLGCFTEPFYLFDISLFACILVLCSLMVKIHIMY